MWLTWRIISTVQGIRIRMANNQNRTRGRFFCLVLLSLLLLFSAFPAGAESAETIIYEDDNMFRGYYHGKGFNMTGSCI